MLCKLIYNKNIYQDFISQFSLDLESQALDKKKKLTCLL